MLPQPLHRDHVGGAGARRSWKFETGIPPKLFTKLVRFECPPIGIKPHSRPRGPSKNLTPIQVWQVGERQQVRTPLRHYFRSRENDTTCAPWGLDLTSKRADRTTVAVMSDCSIFLCMSHVAFRRLDDANGNGRRGERRTAVEQRGWPCGSYRDLIIQRTTQQSPRALKLKGLKSQFLLRNWIHPRFEAEPRGVRPSPTCRHILCEDGK